MSLSDRFNNGYNAQKENDNVLSIRYEVRGCPTYLIFDFMARVMMTRTGSSDGGVNVIPFSSLDRGTLIEMRDKLIDLKGNPPELPPEAPVAQAAQKKFNL
ncbi:MAG: hypothetical protein EPN97_13965 [Alphaproteobacteria bacterium]|nr:MAG: hypothetical protein EPN97_13965 [Alphaproteobacteria bacterium]